MRRASRSDRAACVLALVVLAGCALEPGGSTAGPPGSPTIGAQASLPSVDLAFGAPISADLDAVLVVRFTATAPVGTPPPDALPGDAVEAGEVLLRAELAPGATGEFVDPAPPVCGALVYRAWAVDAEGLLSEPVAATVPDGALRLPPGASTGLAAIVGAQTISLAWQDPSLPGFAFARLLRSDAPIEGPTGGLLLYEGTDPAYEDDLADLPPGRTVHYAVFACDLCGSCEPEGSSASATPP